MNTEHLVKHWEYIKRGRVTSYNWLVCECMRGDDDALFLLPIAHSFMVKEIAG